MCLTDEFLWPEANLQENCWSRLEPLSSGPECYSTRNLPENIRA